MHSPAPRAAQSPDQGAFIKLEATYASHTCLRSGNGPVTEAPRVALNDPLRSADRHRLHDALRPQPLVGDMEMPAGLFGESQDSLETFEQPIRSGQQKTGRPRAPRAAVQEREDHSRGSVGLREVNPEVPVRVLTDSVDDHPSTAARWSMGLRLVRALSGDQNRDQQELEAQQTRIPHGDGAPGPRRDRRGLRSGSKATNEMSRQVAAADQKKPAASMGRMRAYPDASDGRSGDADPRPTVHRTRTHLAGVGRIAHGVVKMDR